MRNADQLLVSSLRSEEADVAGAGIIFFALGGTVMLAAISAIVVGLAVAPKAESPNTEQAAS